MKWLKLAFWLLGRERAAGEWRVLVAALVIGVGSVATTGFLADRVNRAMQDEGARFLGADLLVTSPRTIEVWPAHGLKTAHALEFASMVSRQDAFQLATVRAVDAAWPLAGEVRIADRPFAPGTARPAQPSRGSLYVDQELLTLLGAEVGDTVEIGLSRFTLAGIVREEPGQLGGVFGFAPRVFMHLDDVAATGVVQPGSRLSHLYQFSGAPDAVGAFAATLKATLDASQRVIDARNGVENLRDGFDKLDTYLALTALVSLLLAAIAIVLAGRRHAARHLDQAALLRAMGTTRSQLLTLYLAQFFLVGLLASGAGIAAGALAQHLLAGFLVPDTLVQLPTLAPRPALIALASGLLALFGAVLPILTGLAGVPPLRVLRRELPPLPLASKLIAAGSFVLFIGLIALHAPDPKLIAGFVGALAALALALALVAQAALAAGRAGTPLATGALRFGLTQLVRHRADSTLQLGAFTLALFLIALLALVRADLVHGFRQQLPEGAPNHFLVNIAPHQQAEVAAWLAARKLDASALYPMVRGRLVSKDGAPIAANVPPEEQDSATLRRELNLSSTAVLPENNRIVAGRWHGGGSERPVISVESGMAERLGLSVGDALGFQIGDQTIEAVIGSIRQVKWESMQPNFFVIFSPGALDAFPASYIASVYIPPGDTVMAGFVKAFPGVTVLALDTLIGKLEAVFSRIVEAIQLLMGFLLAAGLAVVAATVLAGLDARRHEAVLLRAFGASRAWLARGLLGEFALLGLFAGVLATLFAEIAMALIASRIFDFEPRLHPWLWGLLPIVGAALVAAIGWLTTRAITRVPPIAALRQS